MTRERRERTTISCTTPATISRPPATQLWQALSGKRNTTRMSRSQPMPTATFPSTAPTAHIEVTVGGQTYTLNLVPGTTNYGLLTPIPSSTWNGSGASNNWSTAANWVGSTFNANSPLVFAGRHAIDTQQRFHRVAFNIQRNDLQRRSRPSSSAAMRSISAETSSTTAPPFRPSTSPWHCCKIQTSTPPRAAPGPSAAAISGNFTLTKLGSHTLTLTGANNYSDGTNVNSGTLAIGSSTALPANSAVTVTGPAVLQLNPGIGVQTLASLSLPGNGKIDLNNNDIIVHNGDAVNIPLQLKAGFNAGSGYWNGSSGIVSTAAANDTSFLTTLGYRQSDGTPFDNVNTAATDFLVKYTYYGDADLNGVINGADYQQIDNGFGQHLTGWFNGDFNYDGVVDGTDFALIDNTFNQNRRNWGQSPSGDAGHFDWVNSSATENTAGSGELEPSRTRADVAWFAGNWRTWFWGRLSKKHSKDTLRTYQLPP